MPLYIKDKEVDALAEELKELTNAPSKVDAVRLALRRSVEEARERLPIRKRLARTLAMAKEIGPFAPGDHKRITDELWGEE